MCIRDSPRPPYRKNKNSYHASTAFTDLVEKVGHAVTGYRDPHSYRAAPIDGEEYFLACCRYIELHPVRARMAAHPRNELAGGKNPLQSQDCSGGYFGRRM